MKKIVLFTSVLASGTTFAQFTQVNEPAIGSTQQMYVCDIAAPSYAAVTGTGVTWDYSTLAGANNGAGSFDVRTMAIVAAADTPEGADYPTSAKAVVIQDFMTTYFNSTASVRSSQGFSFTDNGTTTNIILDTDEETLMNYTFSQGNTLTDAFSGHTMYGMSDLTVTGTVNASVDGTGTLKLNPTTTISNVVRYKLVDNASASTPFGNITLLRTQYEYYNLDSSNLPLFVHSTLDIGVLGAPNTIVVVLNTALPAELLSANENQLTGLTVYPNPAEDIVFVEGFKENAALTLVDAQGKTIAAAAVEPGVASLEIANVNPGVYFLHIASANGTTTERVVIR